MSMNGIRGSKVQEEERQGQAKRGSGSRQGKARGVPKHRGSRKVAAVTHEVLEAERADLISQKQTQLGTVVDRHDTLVREMFHLDHYINMVGYDPEEAKTDNRKVFQDYKTSRFSLVDNMATGSSSRATRRTRTEQAQFLGTPSITAHQPASISAPLPTKKQLKTRINVGPPERVDLGGTKGNGRAAEAPLELRNASVFDDDPPTTQQSISAIYVRRNPQKTLDNDAMPPNPTKKRKIVESKADESVTIISRRSGRLKWSQDDEALVDAKERVDNMDAMPPPLSKRIKHIDPVPMPVLPPPPPTPKSNIRRVKLVVRRPPPPITNPKQRPSAAQHNSSVHTFLNSYFNLDGDDIQQDALEHRVHADALILERAERLKSHGGFLSTIDEASRFNEQSMGTSLTPARQSKDHWDHVVDTACYVSRTWRKRSTGQQIAGQWAKAVRGYWDGQGLIKERLKVQEERRLRALAKATIRIVTDEWKKAVFHIREQERLKHEAEEVRRGREHLDAILDQSGQLLETQQGDLTRGENPRSRSSSMSLTYGGWGSDEEEDDDDDEGEENEDDADDDLDADNDDEHMLGEESEEQGFNAPESSEFEEAPPHLDDLDDLDTDDAQTRLLLDTSDPTHTPASAADAFSDINHSDDEFSSVTDIDELLFAEPYSSPQRPLRPHSPVHDSDQELSASLDAVEPSLSDVSPSVPSPERASIEQTSAQDRTSPKRITPSERVEDVQSPALPLNPDEDLFASAADGVQSKALPTMADSCSQDSKNSAVPLSSSNEEHIVDIPGATKVLDDSNEKVHNSGEGCADEILSGAEQDNEHDVPEYLKPFAVAPVEWSPDAKITPPLLLRGNLRPYQQSGLEWLASLHINNLNGILADEMGLGKTIQTIALLAHLACDRGIWGPHLIVVPTSVLLNWEMEFKKFLPGFRVLSYHGSQKRRKELRQGWNDKHHFNVCITSYTLASRDAHIFKRRAWYYLILDEAHMIKNFKSQRWNTLLMFRSFRRLLLTGTPLQNNLTELWALLQFLMSGANFASLKDFGDWFSNPVEKAIEMGNADDDDTMQRVAKLHTVLRPYLLRRLKRDVEKELPSKYEHLVVCPLSKRQRFLYDEFMARAHTRDALESGVYQKIANILMQLRKVCNHPDLFEVRPIVTSFTMERSAIADFEIKELLIRRRLFQNPEDSLNLCLLGLKFIDDQDVPTFAATATRELDATSLLPFMSESLGEPPPKDFRTIAGFRKYSAYLQRARTIAHWSHIGYLNRLRCSAEPIYSSGVLAVAAQFYEPLLPVSSCDSRRPKWEFSYLANSMVKSYIARAEESANVVEQFAFVTPAVVALELPRIALSGCEGIVANQPVTFDDVLHKASVKLQIAFPDPSLLQYDCGKLQELTSLLRVKKAGGHRILIFTQMTKILDILEIFLNFHGYLYLRLDGATKIEDRQYITERFNADPRIFCFIASSRSGGVGINLTGADTVVFYDSDFNPQMDRQCEDRAHRIGQIRDVHIYRFVSQHTVEEALLRKANQKRSLDDLVIQKGEFDWRSLFNDQSALSKALEEFEDTEDVHAAAIAATEEVVMQGADEADFGGEVGEPAIAIVEAEGPAPSSHAIEKMAAHEESEAEDDAEVEGGSVVDFMIAFVEGDIEFFREWRL